MDGSSQSGGRAGFGHFLHCQIQGSEEYALASTGHMREEPVFDEVELGRVRIRAQIIWSS